MCKVCIVEVSGKMLPTVKLRLPAGVAIAAERECFERDCIEVRLEGEGLPEQFRVQEGRYYFRARFVPAADGKRWNIVPAS